MKVRIKRNWQMPAFDVETDDVDRGVGVGVLVELTPAQLERVKKVYEELRVVNEKLDALYSKARREGN